MWDNGGSITLYNYFKNNSVLSAKFENKHVHDPIIPLLDIFYTYVPEDFIKMVIIMWFIISRKLEITQMSTDKKNRYSMLHKGILYRNKMSNS